VAALLPVTGAGGADAQTPKRGGTVIVPGLFGGVREPACLNPFRTCGAVAFAHVEEVLEGAFEFGPERSRPNLVTSVAFTRAPPYTLTYFVRPEARWSDGVAVSARDFVFTDQTIRGLAEPPADVAAHLTYVRSVRQVDPKTVRVVLKSRFSTWKRDLFSIVLPYHALRGESFESAWTDEIDNPKTGAAIASGPFLVDGWDRGSRLVLRRNSRYWGPHTAYLDRLVIRFGIDDPVEELRRGALDVYQIRLGVEPETARRAERIAGVDRRFAFGVRWEHLEFRMASGGHPALRGSNVNSKLVRRALAYGIDRQAMVRDLFGEFAPRMRPSDSAVFLPSSPFYEPNWARYQHRPAEARRLLERAGCRPGADGIYSCAGERLSLRFVANSGSAGRSRVIELAQAQLGRIGVEVRPSYWPGPILLDQVIPGGEWDVWIIAYFYGPDVPVDGAFRCHGPVNATGYCQRLVTRELDQATRIFDSTEYARALNRADVQMSWDVPVIPLWHDPSLYAFRSNLRGFTPAENLVAWNAENWWLDR
jgi:peptide/nickel transport system substrate-binding protein